MSRSSRDNPVCLDKVFSTSGPIACSSCGSAICWLGPDPTHDSAVFVLALVRFLGFFREKPRPTVDERAAR
jgi:hypothetical protein